MWDSWAGTWITWLLVVSINLNQTTEWASLNRRMSCTDAWGSMHTCRQLGMLAFLPKETRSLIYSAVWLSKGSASLKQPSSAPHYGFVALNLSFLAVTPSPAVRCRRPVMHILRSIFTPWVAAQKMLPVHILIQVFTSVWDRSRFQGTKHDCVEILAADIHQSWGCL